MKTIERFTRNPNGRDLIVGDIHGCFTKLQAALQAVRFDPARDRLFCLGDLVDRGPESGCVLEWLGQPWLKSVAGNHEDMAILWNEGSIPAEHYARNGGAWNIANLPYEREVLASAFAALPIAIELETEQGLIGLVHASCPTATWGEFAAVLRSVEAGGLSLEDAQGVIAQALWARDRFERLDESIVPDVLAVIVGHTPMDAVSALGNTMFIDTGAWHPARADKPFVIIDAATLSPAYAALDLAV